MLNNSIIIAPPSPLTDPYFSNVVLLMMMEGTDGARTFTDVKGHTFTANFPNGGAILSSAQAREGNTSLLFNALGSFITSAASVDWLLGSAWTLEMSLYPLSLPAAGTFSRFFSIGLNSNDNAMEVELNSGGGLYVGVPLGGVIGLNSSTLLNLNTWNDVAFSVNNGNAYLYNNGNLAATQVNFGSQNMASASATPQFWFGNNGSLNGAGTREKSFPGYVDKVRLTKGISRYNGSSYVVPSTFPTTP